VVLPGGGNAAGTGSAAVAQVRALLLDLLDGNAEVAGDQHVVETVCVETWNSSSATSITRANRSARSSA